MEFPPRLTVLKDEIHWGPGSKAESFPQLVEYISMAESEMLLAEARAKAMEDCLEWLDEDGFKYLRSRLRTEPSQIRKSARERIELALAVKS